MITEDYVSFETAKLLKEKGFNEECISIYHDEELQLVSSLGIFCADGEQVLTYTNSQCNWSPIMITAPSLQMAMRWLREVHNIGIFPTTFYRHTKTFDGHNYGCTLVNLKTFDVIGNFEDCTFPADSYEQTCEMAIKYCLENLI